MGHPRRHATARPIEPFGLGSASGQGQQKRAGFDQGSAIPAAGPRRRRRGSGTGGVGGTSAPASACARSIAVNGYGVTRTVQGRSGPLILCHAGPGRQKRASNLCFRVLVRGREISDLRHGQGRNVWNEWARSIWSGGSRHQKRPFPFVSAALFVPNYLTF